MHLYPLLTLLLSVTVVSAENETYSTWIRNGALLQQEGKVIIIEDVVNVNISFRELLELPISLNAVKDRLHDIYVKLNSNKTTKMQLGSPTLSAYRTVLGVRIDMLKGRVQDI